MKKRTKIIIGTILITIILVSGVIILWKKVPKNLETPSDNNNEIEKTSDKTLPLSPEKVYFSVSKIDKLSNYVSKHKEADDITALKVEKNKFILELNDCITNDITFITKYLLIYDLDKDTVEEIKYNGNDRIWSVSLFNNKIYYTAINFDYKKDKVDFKVIEADKNLKTRKILDQGQVNDVMFSPKFQASDNNLFYVYVDDYKDSTSNYSKFSVKMIEKDDNITEITSGFYDYGNQTGTTFVSIDALKIYNNNLYFETYSNNYARENKYDIANKTLKEIYSYEVKDDDYVINDFYEGKDYNFYTYLLPKKTYVGGARYYNDTTKVEVPISEYKNITRLNDNLYVISSMSQFYLLNLNTQKLNRLASYYVINTIYGVYGDKLIGWNYTSQDYFIININQ